MFSILSRRVDIKMKPYKAYIYIFSDWMKHILLFLVSNRMAAVSTPESGDDRQSIRVTTNTDISNTGKS